MTPPRPCPVTGAPPALWRVLLWIILASLGLLILSELARHVPCWAVLLMTPLLAYPLWLSLRESFLFRRRLMLDGATPQDCAVRRLAWGGHVGAALLVPLALGMVVLLLALSLRLNAHQWAILIADALLLVLLYRFFQRRIASQIHPHLLGMVVRGWPLRWTNLGLLTLAFFVLSFFVQGAPDLRQESWQAVADQAFQDARHSVVCPWLGWLVGGLDALEQGAWTLAQRFIPELAHPALRFAAWLLLLVQTGLLALLFTRLLLGVLTLIETHGVRAESLTGDSALAKTFILTILVLVLLSIYPTLRLRDLDLSQFENPAQDVLTWIDPCRVMPSQNTETQAAVDTEVDSQRTRLTEESKQRIAQEVDQLFAPVEVAVDDYLDWYFTVLGEYERLGALIFGDFPQLMKEQLEAHLFEATDFQAREQTLEQTILDDTLTRLSDLSQTLKDRIETRADADPCMRASLSWASLEHLERDVWRASAAGSSGATVGVATVFLSNKVVGTIIAKVGAKKSVQAGATMAAKLAAKKGGGVLASAAGGALVCAPSGPWAIVCGVGAGIVTWLAVDKAAIEIDQAVSRDDMRAEILQVVTEEKARLKVTLQERHAALITRLTEALRTTVDGVFIPARDGW